MLEAVALGQDPDTEVCGDHLTPDAVTATPDWDLGRAATAMVTGGFRHLVVCDGPDIVGVLSVRDIVRVVSGRGELAPA
jgi:CBS domain-containing protein